MGGSVNLGMPTDTPFDIQIIGVVMVNEGGDPTDTQSEPKNSFSSLKTDDFVQFLEYISFPQQSALKHLLTDE